MKLYEIERYSASHSDWEGSFSERLYEYCEWNIPEFWKLHKELVKLAISLQDEQHIDIETSDNGIGRKKSKELKTVHQKNQQSKGMENIKKRVAILNDMYSDKISVKVEDLNVDRSGTKVILTLKKD